MTKSPRTDAGLVGTGVLANRRGKDVFASADRHSRTVRVLKFAIPVVAVVAVAVFASATLFRDEIPAAVSTDGVSMSDGRIVMASPKLDGMTGDKRPYKMQAERAFQEVKKDGLVELEKITADLPFGPDTTAKLTAGGGIFDNSKSLLNLDQGVELVTSDGMHAVFSSARVDMSKNGLSTSEPVVITTEGSRISADSMFIEESGKLIVFEKRVKLTIDPKKFDAAGGGKNDQQAK